MNEVKHFTKASEIQHFAEVKVSQNDNVYGVTWAEVVKKYLQTAYSSEDAQAEVEAFGKTYKVLKRTEVTAFYDKDGNTLFDVTNERLQAEYEMLFTPDVTEPETAIGRTIASIEREAFERATQAYEQKKMRMLRIRRMIFQRRSTIVQILKKMRILRKKRMLKKMEKLRRKWHRIHQKRMEKFTQRWMKQ